VKKTTSKRLRFGRAAGSGRPHRNDSRLLASFPAEKEDPAFPGLTRRQTLTALAAPFLLGAAARQTATPTGIPGNFTVVRDWRFGRTRADATMRSMHDLRRDFRFRYIYDNGHLDGLPSYWSRHRDYPDGDPRSLHVFGADCLVLKGRIPPGGGLRPGGIESGMLRALLPVMPGMAIEMRAKLPRGLGTWPAFWLNPGVEYPDGHFSKTPWPPEIDIFEFFVWQGRTRPKIIECHTQDAGRPRDFGDPHDLFSKFTDGTYQPGPDFSAAFHVFALNWIEGKPVWYLDGQEIKQTVYAWNAPPAHILVTNQIGMSLPGTDMTGIRDEGEGWDYSVDYIRVFRAR
jgi:hypothetical protein